MIVRGNSAPSGVANSTISPGWAHGSAAATATVIRNRQRAEQRAPEQQRQVARDGHRAAGVGRFEVGPPESTGPRRVVAGRAAVGLIGAMFVGTYLGQLKRSRWVALPATLIGAAVTARIARGAGAPARGRHGG